MALKLNFREITPEDTRILPDGSAEKRESRRSPLLRCYQ